MKWCLAYALLLNLLIFTWYVIKPNIQKDQAGFTVDYSVKESVVVPLLLVDEIPEEQRFKKSF
jgi:hypothetical protein